jgi:hypothetical protein
LEVVPEPLEGVSDWSERYMPIYPYIYRRFTKGLRHAKRQKTPCSDNERSENSVVTHAQNRLFEALFGVRNTFRWRGAGPRTSVEGFGTLGQPSDI